jgi:hypothetical protein
MAVRALANERKSLVDLIERHGAEFGMVNDQAETADETNGGTEQ